MLFLHLAAAAAKTTKGGNLTSLVLIAAMAVFYFAFYRPRMKKMKAKQQAGRAFEVGDEVQTIGGLIATVVRQGDGTVTVRTAGGQEMEFTARAIHSKFVRPDATLEPEADGTSSTEAQ